MLGPSMRGVEAMHVLVGLVTILLFLFAFVSFRAFRILVGVAALGLVGLLVAMVIGNREPEERKQTEEAKQQIEREKSAQRQKIRWSRVAPSNVELRDPSLIRKQSDEFTLAASLKNNSVQMFFFPDSKFRSPFRIVDRATIARGSAKLRNSCGQTFQRIR
jgi:hypothetical protein